MFQHTPLKENSTFQQPALFLPHGAPDLPLSQHEAKDFLRELGTKLPRPDAILIISAHWETHGFKITTSTRLQTIYDFYGFGRELYEIEYPAVTDLNLVSMVTALLGQAGHSVLADKERGLDHGAWVPLLLLYPQADIPVVQLSLNMDLSAINLYKAGQALSPLRKKNVLIIGSGGLVHNLSTFRLNNVTTPEWALAFDRWFTEKLVQSDLASILDYEKLAPNSSLAHPTTEHLLPIFFAAGAGGDSLRAHKLHSSFSYGTISMSAWSFG